MILPNGFPTLVHISLSDKSGDSTVIVYVGGKAQVDHDKQIGKLKQYRTFGGDKPLPGERTPSDHFESTYAPNVVWIDMSKFDFSQGRPAMELQVEKQIFSLNGEVTDLLEKAKPFVFGMNKH